VKLLHTSDWHVGKTLRGMSRVDEHRDVLGEIVGIADRERVDVVLVAGDLFDTAAPAPDATALVWDTLLALHETGARVVVVGGNHDHQQQLDAFAPVLERLGIVTLGMPAALERAVVEVDTRSGGGARVALLPWVSQRWAIRSEQLMGGTALDNVQHYAQRVARIVDTLCAGFADDAVNVVTAHCMVQGAVLGGGERDAQTIFEYHVPATVFPASASYVALGHLHRMQKLPAAAPVWYSGSPVQVDFGEERDVKHVLLVDAEPGMPARVEPVPLASGWRLRTVHGTLGELADAAADVGDAWLRVFVREPARAGLADDVRALLPRAVDVRVEMPARGGAAERPVSRSTARTPRELFVEYLDATDHARDERLLALFDALHDADTDADGVPAIAGVG
jgi:exonuclease SbcD